MSTICFFGIYDPLYARNRVLIHGFKENNWEVLECRVDTKIYKGLSRYIQLIKLSRKIKSDIILVAFPGHTIVCLARILFFNRKIYFDAFLSRFDSNVYDRKAYGPFTLRGILDWLLDWNSCVLASKIFLDTNEHIDYFSKTFFLNKKKMIRVPISADIRNFYPRLSENHSNKFIIHFHGMFIPLQGIEYIIQAADILRVYDDIIFNIIGSGQKFQEISKMIYDRKLSNVFLLGMKSYLEIPEYISKADICLGIFGDTQKTKRVIPNKVYEYIAMKKAVITADTPAIRELFENERDMLLCACADGTDLANVIIRLKNNEILRSTLVQNSYENFIQRLQPRIIVSDLINFIQ